MKQLIINADDFGMNLLVSQSIIDLYKVGIVTSASLITNFKEFNSSVDLLRHTKLDMGLHLNLLDGIPVNNRTRYSALVDKNGLFLKSPYKLFTGIVTKQIREIDLEREIRAQIEKALVNNITLSHIDGHEHVHMFPLVSNIILRIAGEYKIKAIRIPIEAFKTVSANIQRRVICNAIRLYSIPIKSSLTKYNLQTADYFTGIPYVGRIDEQILKKTVQQLPDGVTELMCHPVNTSDYSFYTKNDMAWVKNHNFIREFKALESCEVRQLIQSLGIELIRYNDLTARKDVR